MKQWKATLPGFSAEAALVPCNQRRYYTAIALQRASGRVVAPQLSVKPVACMTLNAACRAGNRTACQRAQMKGC